VSSSTILAQNGEATGHYTSQQTRTGSRNQHEPQVPV